MAEKAKRPSRQPVMPPDEKTRKQDVVAPGEEDTPDQGTKSVSRSAHTMASVLSGLDREHWGSPTQFLMSCIASAVGLGNVWRFPAICAKNGGAAFLFPYLVVLAVIARPLFILELSLGQFSSKGSVRCWDLSPMFQGIGITGSVSSVLLSTFYIMLLAWSLIYVGISGYSMFLKEPLWAHPSPGAFFGGKILHGVDFDADNNGSIEVWTPIWHLVLALVLAWLLIWVTMVFGVEASGKVAYVTALAPYVVLLILLIVGCLLEGADVGLKFFFIPEWKKLLIPKTWFEAVGQCFFSLGIGFGGCIMFASYNDFHNDIVKDVLIVSLVDMCTSVLAGFSLMSILGFQALRQYKAEFSGKTSLYQQIKNNCQRGNSESDVKICFLEHMVGDQGGAGLAFVHYPAAMVEIQKNWGRPWGGLIALLFFFMLILLAVGSANGFVGTTVTIICDRKPNWKRGWVVSGVCGFSCFLGLIYTNGMGSNWFDVVDMHGVTAVVYILSFLEVVAVIYVYGLKNFCDDLQFMRRGKKVGWYLRVTWVCLPVIMFGIFLVWVITYKPLKSWTWVVGIIGWSLTIAVVMVIPITMLCKYCSFKKNPWRKNVSACKGIRMPSPRWGPKDPLIRSAWKEFKASRESSYHIWDRYILRRNPANIPPSAQASYATQAFPPSTTASAAGSFLSPPLTAMNSGSGSVDVVTSDNLNP